jgi:RecJ-like exonuclease
MSKSSHSDQSNIEFSQLTPEEISLLAEGYLANKQELEKSIRLIDIVKLSGFGSIFITSLVASAPFTALVIGVISGLTAMTINTESLAESLNKLKREVMGVANEKEIKSKYKLGQFVQGKVESHSSDGVFVNLDESLVKGLIKFSDFLDEGEMSEKMYPKIGESIGAVVVGYNENNCCEIYLNAKPSILHKTLVPLQVPN